MQSITEVDDQIRAEIERRLSVIEADEGVRFLLAVESGSRAWGFPSPDSDYDVRFIYVRPRNWYLALEQGRDVIEQPIVDEIDLNGWDIRKALGLLLKSNAIVGEWMSSPIRYRQPDPAIERLAEFAALVFNPRGVARHYAALGLGAAERWFKQGESVSVKKYFYALRPALAIRALRRDSSRPPPMNLQQLVELCGLDADQVSAIEELVVAKSRTNELSNACRHPTLDNLISSELGRADELPERKPSEDGFAAANQYFLDLVEP